MRFLGMVEAYAGRLEPIDSVPKSLLRRAHGAPNYDFIFFECERLSPLINYGNLHAKDISHTLQTS